MSKSFYCASIALMLLARTASAANQGDGTRDHPFAISTEEVAAAYTDNKIAADDKFKGKFVTITDRVAMVKKSIMGYPRIILTADGEMRGSTATCTCEKTDDQMRKATALHKGDTVSITGKFLGYLLGGSVIDQAAIEK